jgi:hypothetical protein
MNFLGIFKTTTKTTWLQFFGTNFEVPTEWLKNQISKTLEEFLNTYTSDDAIPLYMMAILQDKLLNERKFA